ncbi:unnamed protein product [Rotaria socialis]|uniref:PNPLA domain-containing protein n=1 Tax=Rotaria socialis TaxID=392032 RepID=A0A818LHM9_9BILA|nr:unnamed protein product [Rotaria socialis]CAF4826646.1 unnamed protein product [Rotaria socialis]
MSLKLSNLFQQIDAAIATASSAENIAKAFKNTLEFIQDNLEGEDEAQFNQAKYQYHFKKFKYLSSVGKHEESKREENLSKRYGSKLQPVQQSSMTGNNIGQSFESQIFDNPIQSQNSALSYATTAVQQCSTRLQEICSHFPDMKSVVTDIEILVGNFIVDTIQSYEEYSDVNTTASKISLILNLLKNQITTTTLTVNQEATTVSNDVSNNNQSEIAALAGAFCITVDKCLAEYRRILCHFVLSQRNNIMQILFSNVPVTQECIISHARKLSLLFHPDKAEESDRIEFREVFDCIILCKQKLIDKLTNNGDISDRELVNHHQTAGKRLWEIARDYSRARNRAWTTLVHLREDNLKSQTEEELEQYQKSFASQAYEQYRAAAIALGDQGTAEERSEMRRMMAISLYTGEQLLQAQIYVIAAMHILAQNIGRAEAEKLKALQPLLEKIRSPKVSTRVETANSSTIIPPTSGLILGRDVFNTGTALFQEPTIRETLNSKLYVALKHHKAQLYAAFLHELASNYSTGCSLISIVKYGKKISIDIYPRQIVQKLLNHEFRPDGIAYLLNLIGEALLNKPVLMHQEKDFSSLQQPLFSTMNELAIICFSEVFSARSALLEQAEELDRRVQKISLQDAEIRFFSKIKKNIKSKYLSYAFSIPKEYFTDALRTPYTTRLRELGDIARLNFAFVNIIIGGNDNFCRSQNAVLEVKRQQVLSAHNQFFMISDTLIQAIDDLLLALGLIPKPLVDKDILPLEDNAVFENIQQIKVNNAIIECGSVNKVSNISQLLKVLGELNNCPATLSQEEFSQQVEELAERNSENENFKTSITELLKADKVHNLQDWRSCYSLEENCTPKKAHIPFLSQIFNVNICTSTIVVHPTKGRLFVAQDFPQTNPPVQSVIFVVLDKNYTDIIGAVKTCDLGLNSLYNELHIASTNQKKIEILQKLAIHHRLNAEHFEKVHRLQALTHWHEAKKSYTKILGLDSNILDAALGFGKSLCMLSKLETAEVFLRRTVAEHPHSAEAWYLLAFTKRKRHLYEEANYFIQKALEKDSNYGEAINESKVISTLLSHSMSDRLKVYNNMALSHKSTSGNSSSDYNVLSIDGGGIRGLIPAEWLAELERRTKRSVASLFHMIAGVSTGAIVAAGLCAPSSENPFEPRYKAVDIVKLYETRSNEVFQRAPTWIPSPLWQFCQDVKYTDSGRQDLFSEYFGNMRLSHALTDLVIPAVKSDGRQTHLFNRHNCRANTHRDHFLREVLMCTTAAPTYFRPYILGDSHFVDGGVQMNNPASAAYNECIRYGIESKDIFILSLGTGDFVPDPLHPGSNRHLLFYLSHRKEIMNIILDGPQYNLDVFMMSLLKEKYQRWQVWFDKPIELDNTDASSIESLFEQARAHFEEIDAYDNGERLGLLIDRLRGDAH